MRMRVAIADKEVLQVLLSLEDLGMIVGIAQCTENDQDVDHGREDGAQAFGISDVFEDPFFGFPDGLGAEGRDGGLLVALERHVQEQEHLAQDRGRLLSRPMGLLATE